MHIPDGAFEPSVSIATSAIGAAGLAYSSFRLKDEFRERTVPLMGSMAAFIFAAQMVNFPLYPLPISGHLMGGVMASVLLGPWAGAGVIAAVLVVQCFLFQDGGVTALGANFINMGLIGSVGGYAIYSLLQRMMPGRKGTLLAAMLAAWFSVILASGAFAVEFFVSSPRFDFPKILGMTTLVHAAIGLGEAVITGFVLRLILLTRPDLVEPCDSYVERRGWAQVAFGGLAVACVVAIFLAPFASSYKDGLEYVGAELNLINEDAPALLAAPIADYAMPGLTEYAGLATSAAGVVGTVVVFLAGSGLARAFTAVKDEVCLDVV